MNDQSKTTVIDETAGLILRWFFMLALLAASFRFGWLAKDLWG